MGRMLGSFADSEELDRPELNKCPDCSCFFAADACPICGKVCPEHMRAGNRPAPKRRKSRPRGSGRSTFINWYHSWWFIVLMMFIFPIVGIILLATSPHKKWMKILFIVVALIYSVVSFFGVGGIISRVEDWFDSPVEDSLPKDEYLSRCEALTAEQFYRSADHYEDRFVSLTLCVEQRVTYTDKYYNDRSYICYICQAENGSEFKIVIRDCLLEDAQNFISGDTVTVYGEGAGECEVYDANYNYTTAPCLNVAYAVVH